MSGIAQELQGNPMAMRQIAPLIQSAMSQMPQMQQQMPQRMPQQMQQPMQQPMGMTQMGYNPMLAIAQMQRQPMPQVQNPIFGGAIPMDFGLPQASQIPVGYQSALAQYRPSPFNQQNLPSFRNQGNNTVNDGYYVTNYDMQGGNGNDGDGGSGGDDAGQGGEDV